MALAYAQYRGDGVTRIFNVLFPYLSQTHIQVKVNGAAVTFAWLSTTTIQLTMAPADGAVVDVRRVTPRDTLLVDWVDGSTLVETDLDLSSLQVFYLAQEAFDQGEASLGVADDGSYSALTRRISSLADPINDQDAATKKWVITDVNSNVAEARAANSSAQQAKTDAQTALTSTQSARSDSYTARDAAKAAQTAAEAARDVAISNRQQSDADKTATAADRVQTGQDRSAASASAAAAAQSAQQAALFDPSSYYTKTEITQNYYNKTDIDTKVTALNTAVNGKQPTLGFTPVNKAGDTMSGTLTINKSDTIYQVWVGAAQWSLRVGSDGNIHLWSDTAGASAFQVSAGGAVTTKQLGDLSNRIETRAVAWANDRVSQISFRRVGQNNTGSTAATDLGGPYLVTGYNRSAGGNGQVNFLYYATIQGYDPVRGWWNIGYA